MKRQTKQFTILILSLSVLILIAGCSQQQKKNPPSKTSEKEAAVSEVVEEAVTQADESEEMLSEPIKEDPKSVSEQAKPLEEHQATDKTGTADNEAQQKLKFAAQYMNMARKGLIDYSQAVVICRDVIENHPDPYQQQARELLLKIPTEMRSKYNITDQELGL